MYPSSLLLEYMMNKHFPYIEGIVFACFLATTLSVIKREVKRWFWVLAVITGVLAVHFVVKLIGFYT